MLAAVPAWLRIAMLVLVVAAGAGAYALQRGRTPPRAGGASAGSSREPVATAPAPAPPPAATPPSSLAPPRGAGAEPLRFLAVGGGATPESTEVSLEQNLALLAQVLPGPGALLFGGGPGS